MHTERPAHPHGNCSAEAVLQSAFEILETIHEGYIAISPEYRIAYFNRAAEAMFDVSRDSVLNRRIFEEALEPLRGTVFDTSLADAIQNGNACRMEEHVDRPPYANWYRLRVVPCRGGAAIYFRIVTERKRNEEALRRREGFRQLIMQLSTEFIHIDTLHIDSQINDALRRIGEFTGVDRSYVFSIHNGDRLMDVSHEWCAAGITPDAPRLQNIEFGRFPWLAERMKAHDTVAVDNIDGLPADARTLQADLRAGGVQAVALVPVVYGDRLMGIAGFDMIRATHQWHDETLSLLRIVGDIFANALERKRTEQEHQRMQQQLMQAWKMDSIGWLAGGIAHDFNNMLSPIIGYAEIMLRTLAPGDSNRKRIENIHCAGERARDLTAQLLAFSRKQMLTIEVTNLAHEIAKFEPVLRRMVHEDIDIDFFLPESSGNVRADVSQLQQIVMNLAINAQEAMPGGGRLLIETAGAVLDEEYASHHLGASPGRYVALIVTDTGCGMTAEQQKRIFDPFYSSKRRARGTGLGLSTVYGIVKQHGGSIWVYSERGQGTTFKVYLPAVDEPVPRSESKPLNETTAPVGNETVLVVEDDPMVRRVAVDILESLGYQVLDAGDPQKALDQASAHEGAIDLLVTDVVLPQMNGRELFTTLTQSRPGLKALFMSGYTDNVIAHHGILDKDIHFLQKPFAAETLATKAREALEG